MAERTTKLFCVDENDGGCLNWVAAYNAFDAIYIITETRGCPDDMDGIDELMVYEVDEYDGRSLIFTDDDGAKRTMWEEWERDKSRRFVASTEV